ncbi:MAG: hypothetical protein VXX85_03690, partial [Candidatus Margulisiibacteriota bacterium]|nr:hypothetical protein [Candidatus Margulisiibacteriota bacterium]
MRGSQTEFRGLLNYLRGQGARRNQSQTRSNQPATSPSLNHQIGSPTYIPTTGPISTYHRINTPNEQQSPQSLIPTNISSTPQSGPTSSSDEVVPTDSTDEVVSTIPQTHIPTAIPTVLPIDPTSQPSFQPTSMPSGQPIQQPVGFVSTNAPTSQPSFQPTSVPSSQPIQQPVGFVSTNAPTSQPSFQPTSVPSSQPVQHPGGDITLNSLPHNFGNLISVSGFDLAENQLQTHSDQQTALPSLNHQIGSPAGVPTISQNGPNNFENYVNNMGNFGTAGDQITLIAAANLYNVTVVVHYTHNNQNNDMFLPSNGQSIGELHLAFNGGHYMQINHQEQVTERGDQGNCQFAVIAAELNHLGLMPRDIQYNENSGMVAQNT